MTTMGGVRPEHGPNGIIGSHRGQLAPRSMISTRQQLPNESGLLVKRFQVTLNRVGGIHMGNPGYYKRAPMKFDGEN